MKGRRPLLALLLGGAVGIAFGCNVFTPLGACETNADCTAGQLCNVASRFCYEVAAIGEGDASPSDATAEATVDASTTDSAATEDVLDAGTMDTPDVGAPLCASDAGGTLDRTFGMDGVLYAIPAGSTLNSNRPSAGYAIAADPDGVHFLTSGTSYTGIMAVMRFDHTGALDDSFGANGLANAGGSVGRTVIVQSDRKPILVGTDDKGTSSTVQIARFGAGGTLDPSFADGGVIRAAPTGQDYAASGILVQPDGKVLLGGLSRVPVDRYEPFVARYLSNGTLDPSFGDQGIVRNPGVSGEGMDLALQPDGKIVLGAGGDYVDGAQKRHARFGLIRYLPNGTRDSAFGQNGDGTVATDFGDTRDQRGYRIALDAFGRIVVAGDLQVAANNHDFQLARFTRDGLADASFGTNGRVTTDFDGWSDRGTGLVLLSGGRIAVAGESRDPLQPFQTFALARYLDNGSLDPTFGTQGLVLTPIPEGATSFATATYLIADPRRCRLLVAGIGRTPTGPNTLVVAAYRQ